MLKFQAQVYRISDILGWDSRRELILAPQFQRRSVWKPRGKSFLIDSILRGIPLPQFFIREIIMTKEMKTVREVVDGQQRLSTILSYIRGGFTVLPMHNKEYARKRYDELPDDVQRSFLSYPLSVNILDGTPDADVLEIFRRINSYSVPLNEQELLNARFAGAFSQSIAHLAREHNAYWKLHRILSENDMTRMKDIQLTSELVIAMLLGLQEKKTIRTMYETYDADFPQINVVRPRFSNTMQACVSVLGGNISNTIFQRPPLFYSLFCAVYDVVYGLKAPEEVAIHLLDEDDLISAQEQLIDLSEFISDIKEGMSLDGYNKDYVSFYEDTKASTDKLPQRQRRHKILTQIIKPSA